MQKMASALIAVLFVGSIAFGAGLDCTSTASEGLKKVMIDLGAGITLSRMAFGPCHGPPPTCRPIDFSKNLRAALDPANRPLGQYYGENGHQTLNVKLTSLISGAASGVAQVSLGPVGRPVHLNITCQRTP